MLTYDPHGAIVSHLPVADDIIILDAGQIVAEGTFDELRASAIDVQSYISNEKKATSPHQRSLVLDNLEERDLAEPIPSVQEETSRPASAQPCADEDGDENGAALKLGSWLPYKFYFEACDWNNLVLTVVTLLCVGGFEIGLQARTPRPNWARRTEILVRYFSSSGRNPRPTHTRRGSSVTLHSQLLAPLRPDCPSLRTRRRRHRTRRAVSTRR